MQTVHVYQQTVEKDVAKHSQTANDEVNEVVEELKVQHHGFVAACEGPSVPHETDQEDDFIAHLQDKVSLFLESNKTCSSFFDVHRSAWPWLRALGQTRPGIPDSVRTHGACFHAHEELGCCWPVRSYLISRRSCK